MTDMKKQGVRSSYKSCRGLRRITTQALYQWSPINPFELIALYSTTFLCLKYRNALVSGCIKCNPQDTAFN